MPIIEVASPMPAVVVEFCAQPGERVESNQEIVIIESMKMEVPVEAPEPGTVRETFASPGEPVAEGQLLLTIET